MKYTVVKPDAFKQLALNAGLLLSDFDVQTGTLATEDIIAATTGGMTFSATPTYQDYGSDVDNCPPNLKGLKKLVSWEAKLSGSAITFDANYIVEMLGAADATAPVSPAIATTITPRADILSTDFKEIWFVCDYSDHNEDVTSGGTTTPAGFIAIKLDNALNTKGFELKSANNGKGQASFEYVAHYETDLNTVPFEIYIYAPVSNDEVVEANGEGIDNYEEQSEE